MHPSFSPYTSYQEYSAEEMTRCVAEFYADLRRRRNGLLVEFCKSTLCRGEVIEECLRAAGTAPSGANMQPWHFVVVSDPAIKRRVRSEAEKEEHEFYHHKATPEWLDSLAAGHRRAQTVS